jgi:glycerol-3-phosphate acyltransferase PlsY
MAEPVRIALVLAAGLLLGSLLPCEFFAKLRKVDIGTVGDGNPGGYNALIGLGPACGVATSAFDLSKGVVVLLLARALGLTEGVSYLAGLMAVVGHRFPVYKGFRGGGQAMGAAAGLFVFAVATGIARGWLSWLDLGVLVAIGAVTLLMTRAPKDIAITMLPVCAFIALTSDGTWQWTAFLTAAGGHIWVTQVVLTLRARSLVPAEQPSLEEPPAE